MDVWEGDGEARSGNEGQKRPVRGELELAGGNGRQRAGSGREGRVLLFYRCARLRGEANNIWGRSIWPGRGRRQATASGDAGGRAGTWQVEDEQGRRGSEQNQGRTGPFGRSRGSFLSPEYGRHERRDRCWQWQSRK